MRLINSPSMHGCFCEVVEFCKDNINENIEIVVPDKLTLFMEKFLFEKLNLTASFNIKVSSFNRFAKKNLIIDEKNKISKVGSLILINKILNENIGNLKVIKSSSYSFSYAESIFNTIYQLKASKILPSEMLNFSSSNVQMTNKIQDLGLIYSEYETQKAGLLDGSDEFLASVLSVSNGREKSHILFVGFEDFTSIEYSIIERLAISLDVLVFNTFNKGGNQYIYNQEIETQLKNICLINKLPFHVENKQPNLSSTKNYLQTNIFSLKKNKYIVNDETISVFCGNSIDDELEFVARKIRELVIKGEKYNRFGVAVYNLENCLEKVKNIFSKYEINYYLDTQFTLNKSVLYKFLCSLFKYNQENYNLCHLIDIINSPFFDLEEDKKREIINNLIFVDFKGNIENIEGLKIDEDSKNKLVDFVTSFTFKSEDINTVIEQIKSNFTKYNFDLILQNLMKNLNAQDIILLKKSKEIILNLFDEIVKFYVDIDILKFFDLFYHISNVVKINNLPLTLDAVKVVDADNCLEIFDELFIVNCNKDNAPNLKNDCGIILDAEIEKLNFKNKLSPTISHINKISRLKLFNLSLMFNEDLNVSYSNLPSTLASELLTRLQVKDKENIIDLVAFKNYQVGKKVVLSKSDYFDYLCRFENNNEVLKNKVKNNNFNQIANENLKFISNFTKISASRLENYFKCPFSEFLTYSLNVNERETGDLSNLDIGSILHLVMYNYYQKNKDVGDIYEFCKNEIFNCIDKNEKLNLKSNAMFISNLIDEAVRAVNGVDYIDNKGLFVPEKFEMNFSKTPLKLKDIDLIGIVDRVDTCQNEFRIIDYKSGHIETKLSNIYYGEKLQLFLYACAVEKIINKNFVGGFYLPLHNAYLRDEKNPYSLKGYFLNDELVLKNFDKTIEPSTYCDVLDVNLTKDMLVSKRVNRALDSGELNNVKNYAKKVSEKAVEEISSGYIAPSPNASVDPCRFCKFKQVCLHNSLGVVSRDEQSVTNLSFEEVHHD